MTVTTERVATSPASSPRSPWVIAVLASALVVVTVVIGWALNERAPTPPPFERQPLRVIDSGRVDNMKWRILVGQHPEWGPYIRVHESGGARTGLGGGITDGQAFGGIGAAPAGIDSDIIGGWLDDRVSRVVVEEYSGREIMTKVVHVNGRGFFYGLIQPDTHIRNFVAYDFWDREVQRMTCPFGDDAFGGTGCWLSDPNWS